MAVEQRVPAVEQSVPVVRARSRRVRIAGVVFGLTTAKVFGAATGFITGPLLARGLGTTGRGDLAAILVPLSLAPALLGFGVASYAYRALPCGWSTEEVMGSLGVPLMAIGLVLAALAVPAADFLAGGREVVRTWLIIVFLSMPLLLLADVMNSSLAALERWRGLIMMTLIPFMVPFIAIVVLYLADRVTVAAAAAATIAGSLLMLLPGLPLLRRRPVARPRLTRQAITFGFKGWLGGLALLANLRLDQFMMITAVAPRVLGLYAVATTLGGVPTLLAGGITQPLMTRIAAGETRLMTRAVRLMLVVAIVVNLAMALVAPFLVTFLFGPDFSGAVPMTLVLLVASIPLCGSIVLSSALQADGVPLIPSIGEGLALIITVVGLLVLLGPLGGVGAAIVSLAAYSASFVFQLVKARGHVGLPVREFLVPRPADAQWARATAGSAWKRVVGIPHVVTRP
jgi:O-antigen/teichoic acid export membrane protein